jgi:hypothetical protein
MAKAPAYQWYPGDFRRDTALQSCDFISRALWREMLDLMHDAEPYGHLVAGGAAIGARELAKMVGLSTAKTQAALAELERKNVFSRTEAGVIYSRRMVRDEEVRQKRAAGGIKGGNPKLLADKPTKVNGKVGEMVNLDANLPPTPSARQLQMQSSSSSSVESSSSVAAVPFAHTSDAHTHEAAPGNGSDSSGKAGAIEEMESALGELLLEVPQQQHRGFSAVAKQIIRGDMPGTWLDPRTDGKQVSWSERPPLFRTALVKCIAENQFGSNALHSQLRFVLPQQLTPFPAPKQRTRVGIDSDKPAGPSTPVRESKTEHIDCPQCGLPGGRRIVYADDGEVELKACGHCPADKTLWKPNGKKLRAL